MIGQFYENENYNFDDQWEVNEQRNSNVIKSEGNHSNKLET